MRFYLFLGVFLVFSISVAGQSWLISSDYTHSAILNIRGGEIEENDVGGYTYLQSKYVHDILGQAPIITRLDGQGNVLSSKWYLTPHNSWFDYLAVASNGEKYIAGHAARNDLQKTIIALAKLDSKDSVLWMMNFDAPIFLGALTSAIDVDEDGNVFLTGRLSQGANSVGFFLMKVSSSGSVIWSRSYPVGGSSRNLKYSNGRLYRHFRTADPANAGIAAFDTSGNSLWVRTYDILAVDRGTELQVNGNGITLMVDPYDTVGWTPSHNSIIRTDLSGNLIDSYEFGVECRSAVLHDNGSVAFVIGVADSLVLCKVDPQLNMEWTWQLRKGMYNGQLRAVKEGLAYLWHGRSLSNSNSTTTIEMVTNSGISCDSVSTPNVLLTPVACGVLALDTLAPAPLSLDSYSVPYVELPDTVMRTDYCSKSTPPLGIHDQEMIEAKLTCFVRNGHLFVSSYPEKPRVEMARIHNLSGKYVGSVSHVDSQEEVILPLPTMASGTYVVHLSGSNDRLSCKFVHP